MAPVELFFDPESEHGDSHDSQEFLKERIALGYLFRDISDDNPSRLNGYTGLDQVIMYSFETYNPIEVEILKAEIISLAQELDGDEVEEGFFDLTNDQQRRILLNISRFVLEKVLTDDNRSIWSDFSGLEQVILFEYGPISSKELMDIKRKLYSVQIELRGGSTLRKGDDFLNYALDQEVF